MPGTRRALNSWMSCSFRAQVPEKHWPGVLQPWALQHSPSTQVPPKGLPPVAAQPGQVAAAGHAAQSKPQ